MLFDEALDYIYSFINLKKLKSGVYKRSNAHISNTKKILDALGYKQTFKVIHIAGTKGKGSTTLSLSKMLESAGNNVGSFVSPHIISACERIRINGEWIKEEDFALITERIKNIANSIELIGGFTVFEIFTVICLYYFYEKKVDYACIETGIGGKLDATNIVDSSLSIITSISFDHMDILGDTLTLIAKEKAGIIKENTQTVVSKQKEEALNVLRDYSKEKHTDIFILGENFNYEVIKSSDSELIFKYKEKNFSMDFSLSVLGFHQAENISTAFMAFRLLYKDKDYSFYKNVADSLKDFSVNGRLTVIDGYPKVIVDGAHNGDSVEKVLYSVFSWYEYVVVLFSPLFDKDIKRMCEGLLEYKDRMSLIISSPKAEYKECNSQYVYEYLTTIGLTSIHIKDFSEAVEYMKKTALEKKSPALIIGSLYSASNYLLSLKK